MKFAISVNQDEDGMYIAECPSIPGRVTQGQIAAQAEANVADAIRECLAVRAELGMAAILEENCERHSIYWTMPDRGQLQKRLAGGTSQVIQDLKGRNDLHLISNILKLALVRNRCRLKGANAD